MDVAGMPLTRHFYELDEVIASLRACCLAGRATEAAFWLHELIDSDEIASAISTLVETYVLYIGVRHLEWLIYAFESFEGEDVDLDALHIATLALCRYKERDCSLVALHLFQGTDTTVPDSPTIHGTGEGAEAYFAACARQGKVRAAFWAAKSLGEEAIERGIDFALEPRPPVARRLFDIVKSLRRWCGIDFPWHTLVALSLMVVGLRNYELAPMKTEMPAFLRSEIATWDSLLGRRGRRIYAPREDCFYLETRRGCMPYTQSTESALKQLGTQDATASLLRGTECWADVPDGRDDEAWEAWTTRIFVDDIPDEWSAADRAKSHGPGKVGGLTAPTVEKWLRRFNFAGAYYTFSVKPKMDGLSGPVKGSSWSAIEWLRSLWRPGGPCEGDLSPKKKELVAAQ